MSRSQWIISVATFIVSAALYLIISCTQPINPYQPSNAKISLTIAPTPTLIKNNAGDFVDSIGNTIRLGVKTTLSIYIDSIIVQILTPNGLIEKDTVFKNVTARNDSDTVWYNFASNAEGKNTIKAQAFIQQKIIYPATAEIVIYSKPIRIVHSQPHLVIGGLTVITFAQTCSLSVTVLDSNAGQVHTFYVQQDSVAFTAFIPPFKWAPPAGFIGTHRVIFKVTDTDSPTYFDTLTKTITITDTAKVGPHWTSKTLAFPTTAGTLFSLGLSDKVSGDSLSFVLLPGLPLKDTIIGSTYSYTFAANDTNNYYPQIIAKDKKGYADTLTLHLWVNKTDADSLPPSITLISPSKDTVIGSDSSVVRVKCTDANGISSVVYSLGSQTFTATKASPTDSIFSAMVKGFTAGVYSTVTIKATDASTRTNSATASVKIKYDTDRKKPTIALFDPAKDSMSFNAGSYNVKVVSKDSSGVAAVVYSLAGTNFPAIKNSDSVWSATVSGLVSGAFNKITVISIDSSVNANKDTLSFFIKYDPTLSDLIGPIFIAKSGPANNAVVTDSSVTIIDSIYDPSGVDSVYWTQNGKNPKPLTLVSGSTYLYLLSDTLHRYLLDTITINAQDKSTNKNKSSQTIILNYLIVPSITAQPASKSACTGTSPIFTISAAGTPPLTYQWRKGNSSFTNIATAKSLACTLSNISALDNGTILSCLVGNATAITVASNLCTLTVTSPSTPATSITAKAPAICSGGFDTLTVNGGALGTNASWKWYTDSLGTSAATGVYSTDRTQLTVSPVATTTYYVRAEGTCGNTSVASIKVIVYTLPVAADSITATKTIINPGDTSLLKVKGGSLGSSPGMAWKWYSGGCGGSVVGSTFEGTGDSLKVFPAATKSYYARAEGGSCGITTCVTKKINVVSWTAVNTGLSASAFVKAFVVNGSNIFIGTATDSGAYLTINNGVNWTAANTGLPSGAGLASMAILGTTLFGGTNGNGVYRSTNNGSTWSVASNGLPAGCSIYSIAISGTTIYAATNTSGVYNSIDNGDTWTAINTGLPATNILSIAAKSDTVFCGPISSIVYRSINKGANWTVASTGISGGDAYAFAFNGNKIFAGIENAGVYLSSNNGSSWSLVSNGLPASPAVYSLTMSGNVLFAGVDGVGVFVTQNNGTNWSKVSSGFPLNIGIKSLSVGGGFLFAGTDQGVYRSPLSLP